MNFAYLKRDYLEYGWCLEVATPATLREIWRQWESLLTDRLAIQESLQRQIYTPGDQYFTMLMQNAPGLDLFVNPRQIADGLFDRLLRRLVNGETIYIQRLRHGGFSWMAADEQTRILHRQSGEEWPVSDIVEAELYRWPGGKHWYAKVDGKAVIAPDGVEKWCGYWQARTAAEEYLDRQHYRRPVIKWIQHRKGEYRV